MPSLTQLDKEFEEDIAPSVEVIREIEDEEAEKERQMILDSQTRREFERQQHDQAHRVQRQMSNDLQVSMEANAALEVEADVQRHGYYESNHTRLNSSRE